MARAAFLCTLCVKLHVLAQGVVSLLRIPELIYRIGQIRGTAAMLNGVGAVAISQL